MVGGRSRGAIRGSRQHTPCPAPALSAGTSLAVPRLETCPCHKAYRHPEKSLADSFPPTSPPGQRRWKIPSSLLHGAERGFDSCWKKMFYPHTCTRSARPRVSPNSELSSTAIVKMSYSKSSFISVITRAISHFCFGTRWLKVYFSTSAVCCTR